MVKTNQRKWVGGVLLATVLIVTAIALIAVSVTDLSWVLIPSAILLTLGLAYVGLALMNKGSEPIGKFFGPKQSSYSLGWGVVLVFLGIVLLNAFVVDGVGFIILFAGLLLVIGLIALLSFMTGSKKGGA